jgi:head-tail adaptor
MISALRHRVVLCSQKDVITSHGSLTLIRKEVMATWASIEAKRGSMFSPNGQAMMDNRNERTHIIKIRYRPDLEVSSYAWIYEERRISPPRWFKILTVDQTEDGCSPCYEFGCRLVERSDEAQRPDTPTVVASLPKGVHL